MEGFLSSENKSQRLKIFVSRVFDLAKTAVLIAMFIYLLHLFVITIFVVDGASMTPNFSDKEYLLMDRITNYFRPLHRGDVVAFNFPGALDQKYIKRVVGMPGETIEIKDGGVFINGQKLIEPYIKITTFPLRADQTKWTMGKNEYFVLGDNRFNSNDSRVWGALPKNQLIGRAIWALYPTKEWGSIETTSSLQ
jgi:signal peptidase I